MELVTGGCHINIDNKNQECNKYTKDCSNCPQLNSLNLFDISKKNLIEKKKIFSNAKNTIFAPNTFTKNIFLKSNILKNSKIQTLFLGANKERIKLYSKKVSRSNLNISINEKIILFGTFNLDSPHKGGEMLTQSMKIFLSELKKKKFSSQTIKKIRFLTFGRKNSFNLNLPEINWTHLGMISSIKKLNWLYRSSDVLVCPSTYDVGPHIVTEALLSDLPIVAFDQGVAKDSIINGVNGYIVPCFSTKGFARGIFKTLYNKRQKNINRLSGKLNYTINIGKKIKINSKNDYRPNIKKFGDFAFDTELDFIIEVNKYWEITMNNKLKYTSYPATGIPEINYVGINKITYNFWW